MHVRNSSVIVCTSTLRVNVDSCVGITPVPSARVQDLSSLEPSQQQRPCTPMQRAKWGQGGHEALVGQRFGFYTTAVRVADRKRHTSTKYQVAAGLQSSHTRRDKASAGTRGAEECSERCEFSYWFAGI
jgi:hypothetical protein